MMSCAEFAAKLGIAAEAAHAGLVAPTETLMKDVAVKAKAVLGTYTYGWPSLADSTMAQRELLGYPKDEPGLRTGEMRSSVETMAVATANGAQGLVYSADVVALWFEKGTTRGQPPRSFLFKSLWLSTAEMDRIFGAFAVKILSGI